MFGLLFLPFITKSVGDTGHLWAYYFIRLCPGRLFCMCKWYTVMSDSLRPQGLYPAMFSVHGILQAGLLEWAAIPFMRL